MSGLCSIAATGALISLLSGNSFTLGWTHSIEKIRWEEDYRVVGAMLHLTEARIQGSGAGMEPPPGATLKDGSWVYHPELPMMPSLHLARAGVTPDYEVCTATGCRDLGGLLAEPDAKLVELVPCAD